MATMTIEDTAAPLDVAPPTVSPTGDYDPEFPGSTPEAPYGFKDNGEPYKRRPKGSGNTGTKKSATRMPASESSARAAAGLLGRLNLLVSFAVASAGMPQTSEAITESNNQFVEMAYESLLTDPALCKKILGAGATSGKAGLVMAYSMLAMSILPAAKSEVTEARAKRALEQGHDD